VQIALQNGRLVQAPLQRQRLDHLSQLARHPPAGLTMQQPGGLHGQGRGPGDHPAVDDQLPDRPGQGQIIDPPVVVKTAILEGQQEA
jgi:hypothetical protein